jgi:hypothetical protein
MNAQGLELLTDDALRHEIRLKNRLRRQWQITRDPALKAEVNRLKKSVTPRLNE